MFTDKMLDRDAFARWFGQYASAPKYPDMDWRPEEPMEVQALRERLAGDVPLLRNPASRFSFIRRNENSVLLFVDGQCFECRSEEHTSELQSLMRISYAVFCLKK